MREDVEGEPLVGSGHDLVEVEGRQSPGCPERGESGLRLRQRPSLQLPTRKGLLQGLTNALGVIPVVAYSSHRIPRWRERTAFEQEPHGCRGPGPGLASTCPDSNSRQDVKSDER